MLKNNADEMKPVFIIGSEVPIPGGAQENEESITVTSPEAVSKTISTYKEQFGIFLDNVVELVESYNYATKHNYMIAEIFIN